MPEVEVIIDYATFIAVCTTIGLGLCFAWRAVERAVDRRVQREMEADEIDRQLEKSMKENPRFWGLE